MPTASAGISQRSIDSAPSISQKTTAVSHRLLGLDLLRFIAVSLVVFRHLDVRGDSWCSNVLRFFHTGGSIGVDIFFVLSGFLVSGLLFREYQQNGSVKLGRFLIRRGWKIYPPLWTLIAFSLLIWDLGWWEGFSRRGLIAETFFLQNYVGGLWFNTWSLGVEEHFYFLLAGLVFLLMRFRSGRHNSAAGPFSIIPVFYLVVAVACLAARIYRARNMVAIGFLYASDCRVDGLMFGVLLSYAWHFSPGNRFRNRIQRWRGLLLTLGLLCLMPAFIWPVEKFIWVPVFGCMLSSLGAGMLILGILSFSNLERVPMAKHIARLGSYSYSAYLWHGPLIVLGIGFLREHFGGAWKDWTELLVSFCCTWLFGVVAARAIEIPVLRLRERFTPAHVPNLK
jgi:peptidoglycan/LPS O-acetylase OafA/YrhL